MAAGGMSQLRQTATASKRLPGCIRLMKGHEDDGMFL
jgi:hypothetical protein